MTITDIQNKLYERLQNSGWGGKLKMFLLSKDFESILHTLYNAFNLMLNKNKSRKVPKAFTGFKGTELIDKIIKYSFNFSLIKNVIIDKQIRVKEIV